MIIALVLHFGKHGLNLLDPKCDAEGAEKEIFEAPDAEGILSSIDLIMIEYHFGCALTIKKLLDKNGFVCFKQGEPNCGMIRAVKTRS